MSTNFSWGNVTTAFLLSLQFNAYAAVREITIQWKCHPKRKNGLICKEWASKYPTVAQDVDDVSFALLRVQLFMLATSSAM